VAKEKLLFIPYNSTKHDLFNYEFLMRLYYSIFVLGARYGLHTRYFDGYQQYSILQN
jgi:hypothetical protein